VPVYVLFTKTDLVAGFVEFFGDLKKSERSQGIGATLKLSSDKKEPGKIFEAEFDGIIERIHQRGLRRLATERSKDAKEKIFQFPLELAAIKKPLADFMAAAFGPGPSEEATPILRGFYFTSGTQEGRPMERVLGAMGRAFGLKAAAIDESALPKTEPRSYFLHDVFTGVVFPDQDVAARTAGEIRKQRLQRLAIAFAALTVASVLLVPAIISFFNNRALVEETRRISQEAADVKWDGKADPRPTTVKVDKLEKLRAQAELLDAFEEEGPPLSYTWAMYQGDRLLEPALNQYIRSLEQGFVLPTRTRLEQKLKSASGAKYIDDYNNLKAYLLLNDVLHMQDNADWETGRLTQVWAEVLRPETELAEPDLRALILPHVKFYVDLLRRARVKGVPLDDGLVARVRDVLSRVGSTQRYYDQFVTVLIDQKYDEAAPPTVDNLRYPPITLSELFADRPEALTKLKSRQKEREGKWFEVQGPYTDVGHEAVVAALAEGFELLEREKWVVPLTSEEKQQGDKIQQALNRVRQDYDSEYIRQWTAFFRDVDVVVPANNAEAIEEFRVLSTPDWPYLRLLRALSDHTQFQKAAAAGQVSADGGLIDQIRDKVQRQVKAKTRVDVKDLTSGTGAKGPRFDPVPDKFKAMVGFGVADPPKAKEGEPPPPPPETGLSSYVGLLEQLAGEMGNVEDGPPTADTAKAREKFEEAVKVAQGLLLKMDDTGQELMEPLLMNPLKQGYKALVRRAGGAASGLWEVTVWPTYRDKIKDRYPFNLASSRDASLEDAVAFFKPKDGILWGFYGEHLEGFHYQTGHEFVPKAHLAPRPRPARPFTPFNANLYNCLRRADEISAALFPPNGAAPKVEFAVNVKTVSPIVSDVIFEVEGQRKHYRNEKEFWQTFTWPGEKHGARIQVKGAGGLDEEIVRDGPWGLFRLLETGIAEAQPESDDVFVVTWQMTAPPVTVTIEMKPIRSAHPFPASFFRATNCPPSIGDSFGKG
jgi:type VI secretion system protein ImpL